jgi:hypothetical protein
MQKVLDFIAHTAIPRRFDVICFGAGEAEVLDIATMLILAFLIGPGVAGVFHLLLYLVFPPLLMP